MKKALVLIYALIFGLFLSVVARAQSGGDGRDYFLVFIPLVLGGGGTLTPTEEGSGPDCDSIPTPPGCQGFYDGDETPTPGPSPTPTDTPVNPTETPSDQEPTATGTHEPTHTPTPFGGDQDT